MKGSLTILRSFSDLRTTSVFGQNAVDSTRADTYRGQTNWKAFVEAVVPGGSADADGMFVREAGQIASVLRKADRSNRLFIDKAGLNREFVLRSAAARLAADASEKHL